MYTQTELPQISSMLALHNQKGSIIAFTPDIISHEIILEKILKQNGHGLVFTDSDTVNVAYDTIKNVSSEQDNSLKVIGKDDKSSSSSTTSPVRINSGKWTMDTLQMQYPSIVKYVNDAFFIVDPIIIHNRAELDITDSKVFLSTSSYSNGSAPVYIRILGKGSIVNSTVTSSDPTSSDVGSPSFDPYHPRPYLIVTDGGKLNIINSTISHLGYSMGGLTDTRYARAALGYYDASDFIIANSTIAFNYYGFYSENSDKFKIMSNKIYGQTGYGLDPHTASGDFIIDSNYVHDNGNQGIICSMDCYNVTITNNVVEYNVEGIGLHWLTNTSTIKDNIVRYNDKYGIFIQKSSYDNTVENNTVLGNDKGIGLLEGSNNNRVVYNTVADNSGESIYISSDSKQNKINGNSLLMDGKS